MRLPVDDATVVIDVSATFPDITFPDIPGAPTEPIAILVFNTFAESTLLTQLPELVESIDKAFVLLPDIVFPVHTPVIIIESDVKLYE